MSALKDSPCDGVVAFGGIDWWYHNRGHSECQVMTRLASEMPVLWINSIGMRAPAPGKTELPWRRYMRKLKSTLKGLRRDPESGMWIYSPIFVPRYTDGWLRVNGALLGLQITLLRWLLGMRRPAAWLTTPTAVVVVERLQWSQVLFNRSDEFSRFPEADTTFIERLEARCLTAADRVLYTSHRLLDRERDRCREAIYLGHGVDFDRFSAARPTTAAAPLPDALADLPRPIVGFYGALDDYCVDKQLLVDTARRVAPGTLLVIGPRAMDTTEIEAEPNVRYIGQIPYKDIPSHAAAFDVALMPWLMNEWIESSNPIKLREYLAIGFPIVSTWFPELAAYEEHVYAAKSTEEFHAGVGAALAEQSPARVEARRNSVRTATWDAIAARVAQMLHTGPAELGARAGR